MRKVLYSLVLLPTVALAAGKCRDPNQDLLQSIAQARSKAFSEALRAHHWVQLAAVEKKSASFRTLDAGADQQTVELSLGQFEEGYGPPVIYLMDEKTKRVVPMIDAPRYTGEEVVLCGCAPPGHGGAQMRPVEYVLHAPKGAKLIQGEWNEFSYDVPAARISYAQSDCPPPP